MSSSRQHKHKSNQEVSNTTSGKPIASRYIGKVESHGAEEIEPRRRAISYNTSCGEIASQRETRPSHEHQGTGVKDQIPTGTRASKNLVQQQPT
jgi:hypothetical protein